MRTLIKHRLNRFLICSWLVIIAGLQHVQGADYLTDVKPLLREHCYRCHAGEQAKSGLRLDTGKSALNGGERGTVIVPGDAEQSAFIAILNGTHPQVPRMPYRERALPDSAVQTFIDWIDAGAKVPEDEEADPFVHWSFVAPERPPVPSLSPRLATANPIDHFIRARLADAGLEPSPPANKETLIRRLYLDVIGLPPSPETIDAFLEDRSHQAIEKVVNQLLHSPRFGERWGRHWLDIARYADSNGYSIDGERSIWRYRDYVISAINRNVPFDQFAADQLAGDLLPSPTQEQLIATGFHRNTQINQEGGIDKEQFRIESVVDRVATTGTAFLGLTIACAQCHDHKFDPISQEEYYRMFAFFNNQDEPSLDTPQTGELAARQKHSVALAKIEAAIKESEALIQERIFDWEKYLSEADLADLDSKYRAILTKPRELRTKEETETLLAHFQEINESHQSLIKQQRDLRRRRPRITTTMILREREKPRQTFVHIKGDFTRKGDLVSPGTPAVLNPFVASEKANRLEFAHWLTSADNPLTARVTVNRIWQQYFGRGIVETENDFGTQGIPPSHPKLLDWLAVELIESGWDIKHIHRKILLSATYQQSSHRDAYRDGKDAANRLLSRQSRIRLESEIVRDVALTAAGLLVDTIGGPPARPPQPDGVMKLGQVQRTWRADKGANRYRRGVYTFYYRATPHPALAVFDSPDAFSTCSRRIRSNTPLQALTLLNDPAFHEMAQALAWQIGRDGGDDDRTRIRKAVRRTLGRYPSLSETKALESALNQSFPPVEDGSPHPKWFFLARILLNLDETITRE